MLCIFYYTLKLAKLLLQIFCWCFVWFIFVEPVNNITLDRLSNYLRFLLRQILKVETALLDLILNVIRLCFQFVSELLHFEDVSIFEFHVLFLLNECAHEGGLDRQVFWKDRLDLQRDTLYLLLSLLVTWHHIFNTFHQPLVYFGHMIHLKECIVKHWCAWDTWRYLCLFNSKIKLEAHCITCNFIILLQNLIVFCFDLIRGNICPQALQ